MQLLTRIKIPHRSRVLKTRFLQNKNQVLKTRFFTWYLNKVYIELEFLWEKFYKLTRSLQNSQTKLSTLTLELNFLLYWMENSITWVAWDSCLSETLGWNLVWMFLKLVRENGVINPSSCLDVLKIRMERRRNDSNRQIYPYLKIHLLGLWLIYQFWKWSAVYTYKCLSKNSIITNHTKKKIAN